MSTSVDNAAFSTVFYSRAPLFLPMLRNRHHCRTGKGSKAGGLVSCQLPCRRTVQGNVTRGGIFPCWGSTTTRFRHLPPQGP